MAREEADREDLLRELAALTPRIELELLAGCARQNVVAGRRRDGGLSIYIGSDPVYHFDSVGRLRRAFVEGDLYRSQGTTLARLTRRRGEHETELLRHDLTPDELVPFLAQMTGRIAWIAGAFESQRYRVLRSVPEDADPVPAFGEFVRRILASDGALAPAVKK